MSIFKDPKVLWTLPYSMLRPDAKVVSSGHLTVDRSKGLRWPIPCESYNFMNVPNGLYLQGQWVKFLDPCGRR